MNEPMTRSVSRALVLAAGLAVPSTANAQSSTAPAAVITDTSREQAREHFTRGVQLIQESRWLDAISELEAARDIRVTPPVLYNLGLAQRAVGRNREAVISFRGFLELSGPSRNPDLGRQAETYVTELARAVGTLELRIEPAVPSIDLDGHEVPLHGGHIEVDPGRHTVTAHADGFAAETRALDVPRGGTAVVVIHLVPTAIAAHLRVDSNVTSALIRIDDHDVGFGGADENVRPGHHVIEVRARGYTTFRRDFDAFAGTQTSLHAVLEDQRTVFERPAFWIVTGIVLAGAAATAVYFLTTPQDPYRGSWGLVTNAITAGDRR